MKELSIEEKAKAYDEAIKKAESLYKASEPMSGCNVIIETLFPELKESDDERIRKNLIGYIKGISKNEVCEETKDSWIAWLEKQGEQKQQGKSAREAAKEEKVDNQNCVKHADKVKPKFHEGDWVVSPNGVYWHIDKISNNRYGVTSNTGENSDWNLDTNIYHRFTIQDAKDGDVLYECNEKKPFIFKELETKHIGDIASYCDIFNGIFNPNEDDWTTLDVVPATKEQRDTLMKAMADAGYTFDFKKKELMKIEQKPSEWTEEDERKLKSIVDSVRFLSYTHPERKPVYDGDIEWLNGIKDRIYLQPRQEWTEEDSDAIEQAIIALEDMFDEGHPLSCYSGYKLPFNKAAERLKSIKNRIFPQTEEG